MTDAEFTKLQEETAAYIKRTSFPVPFDQERDAEYTAHGHHAEYGSNGAY